MMIKTAKRPSTWLQREQRAAVGAGVLVLMVHVLMVGTLVRDMAASGGIA